MMASASLATIATWALGTDVPRRAPARTLRAAVGLPASPVELLGLGIDALTEPATIDVILGGVREGRGGWVCTANVDILRQYLHDPDLRRAIDGADLVVADGMPLVWASRVAGTPLPERVTGSSLIWTLTEAAAQAGASVYLLGGTSTGVERAAHVLADRLPGLNLAGASSPPFGHEHDEAALRCIEAEVAAAAPDVVFIGIEFGKARRLAERLLARNRRAWFVCCGISFSFVTGDLQRAPEWMQRIGAEWLYRLIQEPRRLFRRYVVDDIPMIAPLVADALRCRLKTRVQAERPASRLRCVADGVRRSPAGFRQNNPARVRLRGAHAQPLAARAAGRPGRSL